MYTVASLDSGCQRSASQPISGIGGNGGGGVSRLQV
jgi:hypothetical protein